MIKPFSDAEQKLWVAFTPDCTTQLLVKSKSKRIHQHYHYKGGRKKFRKDEDQRSPNKDSETLVESQKGRIQTRHRREKRSEAEAHVEDTHGTRRMEDLHGLAYSHPDDARLRQKSRSWTA